MSRTLLIVLIVIVVAGGLVYWSQRGSEPTPQSGPTAQSAESPPPTLGQVGDAELQDPELGSWPAYGRDYAEQRFSPLSQISRDTVSGLGLAFAVDLGTKFAHEATPLMVDDTLIFPSNWNVVHAVDATTGEEKWRFDPEVPREALRAAIGPISRGVAVYRGKVYAGTLDGRLLALDAGTGQKIWEVDTIVDRNVPYSITGAPRVAKGKVFIGNGGSELGARGYVTAYDAETGAQVWRFFTVPGDPSLPFEHPELEMAAKTWKGGEWWKYGGGGTVWNSIVYDEEFDQVYLGVGNAAPWSRLSRAPGGGDNLFVASIVAVDADTGRMNWYYQTTPGDNWDYTAVQDMILADLEVDGTPRKVLMQAPKNGFFYVIDRSDGTLLRAHPFVATTWASHVDMASGRPVENAATNYDDGPKWILPGPLGGHNWQAMSFDPRKGIAYFPAQDRPFIYALPDSLRDTGFYKIRQGVMNTGVEFGRISELSDLPGEPESIGYLKAFNPLTGEEPWVVELEHFWNGGSLATAGDLVFQGSAMGTLDAYDADTGERLWSFDTYTSILAPPITYAVDGVQYVAILTGTGFAESFSGYVNDIASHRYGNGGELLVFKLDGSAEIARPALLDHTIPEPPVVEASAEQLKRGEILYHEICSACHGGKAQSAGVMPDLRLMNAATHQIFGQIVLDGVYLPRGMASFADVLNEDDTNLIHAYIVSRAREDRAEALAGDAE